jgi:AraC family transcriptional regulator of adaptative response / DNA-3-methyladenine glycosylase II
VVEVDGAAGVAWVRPADDLLLLTLDVPRVGRGLMALIERIGRVFDLRADPRAIAEQLRRDPRLRPLVTARPGLRVPGHFHPFEALVRALLGQQVSIERARRLTVTLVERFGRRVDVAPGLTHLFPTPEALAAADVRSIGLPNARAEAIRAAARAAVAADGGELPLEELPGVGPWTRGYVAMRGLGDPDAYPVADLGLKKCFGGDARALEQAAERWRPFRAYAAMHLWSEP